MRAWAWCGALALGGLPAAMAGQGCDPAPMTPAMVERGLTLAQRMTEALDAEHAAHGTRVVLLARAGQDLSRHGLRYSHMGWVMRTPEGAWRVLHKLNACGTDTGALYRQGLGLFFMENLWRHGAVWTVPRPALQAPLWDLLQDTPRAVRLNERSYSMVSYAWGVRYQQSNQWALETLAMAVEPTVQRRDQAQAWLRFKAYQPSRIKLDAFTRLGARLTRANVAFDDHPDAQRYAGDIDTVTVESVLDWLERSGLAGAPRVLTLTTP